MAPVPGHQSARGAPIRRPAWWKVHGLLGGLLVLISAALWWVDTVAAYSVLFGGLVAIVPNAWFALRLFRFRGAQQLRAMMVSIYSGLAGKLVLTAVLFAIVFSTVETLRVAVFFAAYLVALLLHVVLAACWERLYRPGA